MVLRTIVSAITIVLGALLIAGWGVSQVAVKSVQDGSALSSITAVILESPAARSDLSGEISDSVLKSISDGPVDVEALGLGGAIRDEVAGLANSDIFAAEVQRQVSVSQEQFADALTDDAREPGPLVLMMDAALLVNDRIDDIPLIGQLVPDLSLAPIPVEMASADTMDDARTAYGLMEFAATWFLWIGIGLLGVGLLVSGRRRWFGAKMLLAVGMVSLALWATLTFTAPETTAGWLSGGSDSAVGSVVAQALAAQSAPAIAQRMLWWGVVALAGSAIFALVGAGLKPKKK